MLFFFSNAKYQIDEDKIAGDIQPSSKMEKNQQNQKQPDLTKNNPQIQAKKKIPHNQKSKNPKHPPPPSPTLRKYPSIYLESNFKGSYPKL